MLHSIREEMLEKIDAKLRLLRVVKRETEVVLDCNTRQLEQNISVLGELFEKEVISTPNYPALLQPSISVGVKGYAEGEFDWPRGVTFSEKSKLIYVVDIELYVAIMGVSMCSLSQESTLTHSVRDKSMSQLE